VFWFLELDLGDLSGRLRNSVRSPSSSFPHISHRWFVSLGFDMTQNKCSHFTVLVFEFSLSSNNPRCGSTLTASTHPLVSPTIDVQTGLVSGRLPGVFHLDEGVFFGAFLGWSNVGILFFVGTSPSVIKTVQYIYSLLGSGGVRINLRLLLWTSSGVTPELSRPACWIQALVRKRLWGDREDDRVRAHEEFRGDGAVAL
jgi:hypothetical protein